MFTLCKFFTRLAPTVLALALTLSLMYIQYNTFRHPPGQVQYNYQLDPVLNEAEFPVAQKARVNLMGRIITTRQNMVDAQADLAAQFAAIQAAYATSGGDLLFVQDNGAPSPISIFNSKALGGVRVIKRPDVPENAGASGVTYFDFTIAIEAVVNFEKSAGALWSFRESLSFRGLGGPRIGALEPLIGPPIIQTLRQQTPVHIHQTGEAVGYLAYPTAPPPLFPLLLNSPECEPEFMSARAIGRGRDLDYVLFPVRWRYAMISPIPIAGQPNQWPANA